MHVYTCSISSMLNICLSFSFYTHTYIHSRELLLSYFHSFQSEDIGVMPQVVPMYTRNKFYPHASRLLIPVGSTFGLICQQLIHFSKRHLRVSELANSFQDSSPEYVMYNHIKVPIILVVKLIIYYKSHNQSQTCSCHCLHSFFWHHITTIVGAVGAGALSVYSSQKYLCHHK